MLAFDPVSGAGNSINVCCGQLGLTVLQGAAILTTADSFSTRRGNRVHGEKSPQSLAAFLCTSLLTAALSRLFILTGCFGQVSHLAAPCSGFPLQLSPSPNTVESISDGYSPYMESTV